MKNKITLIVLLLFLILLIVGIFVGIKIGDFQILSVSKLNEKNQNLENTIKEASTLTSITYPDTTDKLEQTYDKHNIQKEKYEELSGFTDSNKKSLYETKQYDIVYLWETIGNYANKHNVIVEMDVKSGSATDLYNLNFKVGGRYVNVTEFIAKLENDSDLYFRIYNFKMIGDSVIVSSTFTVKDVNINPSTITK